MIRIKLGGLLVFSSGFVVLLLVRKNIAPEKVPFLFLGAILGRVLNHFKNDFDRFVQLVMVPSIHSEYVRG